MNMETKKHMKIAGAVAGGLFLGAVLTGPAFAAGGHDDAPKAQGGHMMGGQTGGHGNDDHGMSFGEAGDPHKVDRTVEVIMKDNEYNIPAITVKPDETIRFVLKNQGEFLHEFNIGMPDNHASHQKEMIEMMESGMMTPTGMVEMNASEHMKMGMKGMPMKHDDPNSKLVEPGKTGELIWKFRQADSLQFACNVPGHYESGMVGEIKFPNH